MKKEETFIKSIQAIGIFCFTIPIFVALRFLLDSDLMKLIPSLVICIILGVILFELAKIYRELIEKEDN